MKQIALVICLTGPSVSAELSDFKIIYKTDYLKARIFLCGAKVSQTIGSGRQKALIKFLVEKREAKGITQTELAARLGEYQSFVARIESGQRRIDVVEFIRLSEILGFDPADAVNFLKAKK